MIYLDANATSRLRPAAERVISEQGGAEAARNPSSVHRPGRLARALLRNARRSVLELVCGSAQPAAGLVFTSGGTEACNQMVFGFLGPLPLLGRYPAHLIISAIEHPAVLEAAALLERCGWTVSRIAPDQSGIVQPADFCSALRSDTALIALMAANNETGAIQPVAETARAVRSAGYAGPIVSDMIQAVGKSALSASDLFAAGVSAVAVSGHKLGAPAGIGALIYAVSGAHQPCFELHPLVAGGPQENRLRAGTENLLGARAFGAVADEIIKDRQGELTRRAELRELLWEKIAGELDGAVRLGPPPSGVGCEKLISNSLLLRFSGCRGDDLTAALDINGVAVSTGSACASGKQGVSPTVAALGLPAEAAREVVRFSIDWDATAEQIELAANIVRQTVQQMRGAGSGTHSCRAAQAF